MGVCVATCSLEAQAGFARSTLVVPKRKLHHWRNPSLAFQVGTSLGDFRPDAYARAAWRTFPALASFSLIYLVTILLAPWQATVGPFFRGTNTSPDVDGLGDLAVLAAVKDYPSRIKCPML